MVRALTVKQLSNVIFSETIKIINIYETVDTRLANFLDKY